MERWNARQANLGGSLRDTLPTVDVEVRYIETDQMGHVHHANYVAWFELARTRLCATSGTPYAELVRSRVFARAGMADSGFFRLDEPVPDLAVGYLRQEDGTWRSNHFSVPVVGSTWLSMPLSVPVSTTVTPSLPNTSTCSGPFMNAALTRASCCCARASRPRASITPATPDRKSVV